MKSVVLHPQYPNYPEVFGTKMMVATLDGERVFLHGCIGNTECCGSGEFPSWFIDSYEKFLEIVKIHRLSILYFRPWNVWSDNRYDYLNQFNKQFKNIAKMHYYEQQDNALLIVIEITDKAAYSQKVLNLQ